MHKIGLKLWSINTDAYYTEAQKLYAQGVFDYIELYVLPDSLDHLKKWEALQIPYIIHCAHSAHGFNLADKTLEDNNRRIYEQAKRYADELNAPYIIFHGGCDGTIEETARQLAAFHEPRALIENKPMKPLPDVTTAKQCRGYSMGELQTVMQTAGCGFCLDIGHAVCAANSMKMEPYGYIQKLMCLSPSVIHLSDMTDMISEYDEHPSLGTGRLDFNMLSFWDENHQEYFLTIESVKRNKFSLNDFVKNCTFVKKQMLLIRKADLSDLEKTFLLSNDPLVRRNSFSKSKISRTEHEQWFSKKITSDETMFFIIENRLEKFIAQVRFDLRNSNQHVISIDVVSEFRNQHYGTRILKQVLLYFFRMKKNAVVISEIKVDNIASQRLFENAGFILDKEIIDRDDHFYQYVLRK